jgi:AbrB family looped-hinge helix DNA binding protein
VKFKWESHIVHLVVLVNVDSVIDEKGRICIPIELRKKLNLHPGEKIMFQLNPGGILVRKAMDPRDSIEKVEEFSQRLAKERKTPIPVRKLFE